MNPNSEPESDTAPHEAHIGGPHPHPRRRRERSGPAGWPDARAGHDGHSQEPEPEPESERHPDLYCNHARSVTFSTRLYSVCDFCFARPRFRIAPHVWVCARSNAPHSVQPLTLDRSMDGSQVVNDAPAWMMSLTLMMAGLPVLILGVPEKRRSMGMTRLMKMRLLRKRMVLTRL